MDRQKHIPHPNLITRERLVAQTPYGACVLSFFDGMLPVQRELLEAGMASCKGEQEKLLVILCTSPSGQAPSRSGMPVLLSPYERLQMLHDMGFNEVLTWPFPPGPRGMKRLNWPMDPALLREKAGVLIPGSDLWEQPGFCELLGLSFGQKAHWGSLIDNRFRGKGAKTLDQLTESILAGRVDEASCQLGYAYQLDGFVVEGNKIGRTLGYPTANLKLADKAKAIPSQGVYIGMVKVKDRWVSSMVNIGIRPTLDLKNVTIEAHLFDFDEDIYGDWIRIAFLLRIRDEMRFNSLSELKEQLNEDRRRSLKLLGDLLPGTSTNAFVRVPFRSS